MRVIRFRRRPAEVSAAARPETRHEVVPPAPPPTQPAGGPLTWERLTLRADLAYAIAAADGRARLDPDDLRRADALARGVLARRARRRALIA